MIDKIVATISSPGATLGLSCFSFKEYYMQGTVKLFNVAKGFGFIKVEDGEDIFLRWKHLLAYFVRVRNSRETGWSDWISSISFSFAHYATGCI